MQGTLRFLGLAQLVRASVSQPGSALHPLPAWWRSGVPPVSSAVALSDASDAGQNTVTARLQQLPRAGLVASLHELELALALAATLQTCNLAAEE